MSTQNLGNFFPTDTITNASTYYKVNYRYSSMLHLEKSSPEKKGSMKGVKRVCAFCCLVAILPSFLIVCPLYLKHQVFKNIFYSVTESDVLEVRAGISTIFCEGHVLKMNSSFSAYQINHMPDLSENRKHIRLKKVMQLPDDTLEYWGFYLMNGATVELKVCSRYQGSRILVVKGERNLRTCGLLDHNKNKFGANFNPEKSQVKVTFETVAELVNSDNRMEDNMKLDDEEDDNNGGEDLSDYDDGTKKKHKDFSVNNLKHNKNAIPGHVEKPHDVNVNVNENTLEVESSTKKHSKRHKPNDDPTDNENEINTENLIRRRSHKRNHELNNVHNLRNRRDTRLDGGTKHGGNAKGFVALNESDSISSFENALLECYDGEILVSREFQPSSECTSVESLDRGSFLASKHEVNLDGYYYYIFYSDNDDETNHIYSIFDIYKPSYLYANSKGCINSTECSFPIQMFSDEVVIVEVPTRDGIENEEDDVTILSSECVPRTAVYVIFPIAVLVLILSCAFI